MKRTRTKPRTANPSSSSTRNIGTQTVYFDSFTEIAKLQEQIKLLQLQNNVLKQHTKTPEKSDIITHYDQLYIPETSKTNVEKHSCNCKQNCSSRLCGCVKKNNKCNSSCKCNDEICQNQKLEHDENNKENINKTDMETPIKQSTRKIESIEITKNYKSLFSPNMSEIHKDYDNYKKTYKELEETQISDIHFSFNDMKNTVIKNLQTDKTLKFSNNVTTRKGRKNEKEINKEQQQSATMIENDIITDDTEIAANSVSSKNEEILTVMFDPMKPKHQLSRTPPSKKFAEIDNITEPMMDNNKLLEVDNITEPRPHYKPNKDTIIVSSIQNVEEEKVDWQHHTAQLIPCKKCKRTFMPHRIQKHEACCKKI